MPIGSAELLLVSFLFVSFYGEGLGGCSSTTVLCTIVLQAISDSAHRKLPSGTQILKLSRGKFENWRLNIAN